MKDNNFLKGDIDDVLYRSEIIKPVKNNKRKQIFVEIYMKDNGKIFLKPINTKDNTSNNHHNYEILNMMIEN